MLTLHPTSSKTVLKLSSPLTVKLTEQIMGQMLHPHPFSAGLGRKINPKITTPMSTMSKVLHTYFLKTHLAMMSFLTWTFAI